MNGCEEGWGWMVGRERTAQGGVDVWLRFGGGGIDDGGGAVSRCYGVTPCIRVGVRSTGVAGDAMHQSGGSINR